MTRDEVLTRLEASKALEAPRVTIHVDATSTKTLIAYAGPSNARKQATIKFNPTEADVDQAMKELA